MKIINLDFEDLDEITASELFGAIGVYVLWSQNAGPKPTYLGEGILLKRLAVHVDWLQKGVYGLVAILNSGHTSNKQAKSDSQIAEAFLLKLAESLDYWPSKNKSPGNVTKLRNVFRTHGVLRLNVRGYHPFKKPSARTSIDGREEVSLGFEKGLEDPVFEVPWNKRRG